MKTVLMLMLQAMGTPEAVPESRPDLAVATVAIPLHVRQPCEVSSDPDVITVCGKSRDDQFRLKPIPLPAGRKARASRPGINFDLGPVQGDVHAETAARPDGIPDKRIMVTLKMPF